MTKQTLLEKVSPFEIFQHYIPDLEFHNIRKSGNRGKNILTPFKDEKNPSFSLYEDRYGNLKFKCHSTDHQGDVFQLVADLKGMDCKSQYNLILEEIDQNMKLGLKKLPTSYKSEIWKAEYYSTFTAKAIEFWETRKVDIPTLERFGVRQLKKLTYNNKNQFDYHTEKTVAFEFTVNGRKKLYIPSSPNPNLEKKYYCKTQINSDLFGLRQLPRKKSKFILICEGEGDVLCAAAHGLPAVCFQSANTMPTKQQIRTLRRKGAVLVLCYDLDAAGRKGAKKICWKFQSIVNLMIPKDSTYYLVTEGEFQGAVEYDIGDSKEKITTYKDLSDWLPVGGLYDFEEIIKRDIKVNRKKQFLHIWEQGNSYMKFDQKAGSFMEVSNFLLEVDAQILKQEESLRLCRLIARDYQTDTLAIPSNILNSDTKFDDFVSNLRGNFRFQGTRKDLKAIQKMTYELSDHLEEVDKIGWNKKHDCFILSNAVLNGKVEKPTAEGILDNMYIPVANDSNLDNSSFSSDLKYRFKADSKVKKVYQFFDILASSYSPQVATMAFAFVFSGLFFDWIARKGVNNWFPIFCLSGQKGSGKGSLIKMLMKLFTSDPEEVSITNATKTGFVRILEQIANIPAWLDEFRNSIPNEKIEALKNIYDLIGKVIGVKSNDSRTKRSKILRPTFLTGQESPVNEALFSRCISMNLAIVEKTPEEVRKFSQNMSELDKGIGGILFHLLQFRPLIVEGFKGQYFKLVQYFGDEMAKTGVKANIRLLNNYACVIAPLIVAMKNGLKLSKDGTSEQEMKEVVKLALKTLITQAQEESELDEVNKFLEVVVIAATQSNPILFPGHDFVVDEVENELVIKVSVLSMFNEMYERIYKHKGPDQSAIKKYIIHKPYFKEKRKVYFLVNDKTNNPKNAQKTQLWGVVLDLDLLPDECRDYFKSIAKTQTSVHAITN